jgi:S-DNA-T family DNA segregation ATPase FtsK/SpoIIIE
VVRFLKTIAAPTFERSLIAIRPGAAQAGDDGGEVAETEERDPMFDEAVKIMIESGRGSVSLLQRRLAIGYSRASRLVDQMGLAGILGDHKGSVAREVLITLEEWEQMKSMEQAAAASGTLFEDAGDEADVDGDVDVDDPPLIETLDAEEDEAGEDVDEEDEQEDDAVPAEFADEYRR